MNARSISLLCVLLAVGTLRAGTAAAGAQDHTTAAGYGAGFVSFGALNPGVAGQELSLDAGWVVTAFGEAWNAAGGRLGARVNGAFTQRPLQVPDEVRDVNTWMFDASLILRLLPPREGNAFAPFVSLGGGLIHFGLGTGAPLEFPAAGVVYPGDSQLQWAVVAGGGFDVVPAGFRVGGVPLGLRFEAANHTALRSPFEREDGERIGPVHNLRVGVSLIGLGWF